MSSTAVEDALIPIPIMLFSSEVDVTLFHMMPSTSSRPILSTFGICWGSMSRRRYSCNANDGEGLRKSRGTEGW